MTRSIIFKIFLASALTVSLMLAQTANPKQPKPKNKQEYEAVVAMIQAQDPDARIAAANNLITKFANSDFKALALYSIANSYQMKNDPVNTIVFAEKTIEADPQFYEAMLTIATTLAQRTREFDLDKEEKLGRAEKLANEALALTETLQKPNNPQITEEQWTGAKKDAQARAFEALGESAAVRKNYDVCVTDLKKALELSSVPDPATMVRLANCYKEQKKFDDALATLDKAIADPNSAAAVKQIALQLKVEINKLKAAAK
jgi:tetratricopeptide (TPR) repeat protein